MIEPAGNPYVRTSGSGENCAEGFDLHFSSLRPVLLERAERLCGDPDTAEDLVQEAAIRLFRAWSRIDLVHLPQYAARVLIRVFLDSLRMQQRRVVTVCASQLDPDDLFLEQVAGELEAPLPLEFRDSVASAASRLTPVLRDVVLLFSRGLSYEEMAGDLSIPVGTVRSRLNRARAVLRGALRFL